MKINEFSNLKQRATQQWGQAQLGDARRTQRAVQIGAALAANRDASLPAQLMQWGDLKATSSVVVQSRCDSCRLEPAALAANQTTSEERRKQGRVVEPRWQRT